MMAPMIKDAKMYLRRFFQVGLAIIYLSPLR